MGDVQPVEAYSWYSSHILCHLARLVSSLLCCRCQEWRYAKDNFILCTLKNKSLDHLISITQVLDYSVCELQITVVPLSVVLLQATTQIILGTLMCFLAVIRFIRESLQMYRVTKRFKISRYLSLLARDGMVYFHAYVLPLFLVPCSFPFPCYQANDELLRAAFCYIPYSICWASSTFRGSIHGRRYCWG